MLTSKLVLDPSGSTSTPRDSSRRLFKPRYRGAMAAVVVRTQRRSATAESLGTVGSSPSSHSSASGFKHRSRPPSRLCPSSRLEPPPPDLELTTDVAVHLSRRLNAKSTAQRHYQPALADQSSATLSKLDTTSSSHHDSDLVDLFCTRPSRVSSPSEIVAAPEVRLLSLTSPSSLLYPLFLLCLWDVVPKHRNGVLGFIWGCGVERE